MKNNETLLKVFTIIFIVLTLVSPLFAIGSIICSVKLKKYDEVNGNRYLTASIVAAVIFMMIHFVYYLTYFF
ncbi:hypothetical protein [Staphylococcus debuckii]|uniref:DUF4190 domain-containing protein n=1 Tax=Staphylococcus debuckii TaxID=2044912 RepID=A0ABU9EYC0_9STAP